MNAAYDAVVLPGIRSAIRTGTQYCDANIVNAEALLLSSDAKAAGIAAIIATGISP